jgi:hypothetical protein
VSSSSLVRASSWFDRSSRVFSVASGFADDPRHGCGRSAGRVQTVRISRHATGGSGANFGRSVLTLRMVHSGLVNSPPPLCRQSSHAIVDCQSTLLLELCFSFRLFWDLFLGLVGPL